MFDVMATMLGQLISLIPALIGIYITFDMIGSLLFSKR